MKKCIAVMLLGLMVVAGTGCNKDATTIKEDHRIILKVDNQDERLYREIEYINQDSLANAVYNKRKKEYPEYNINILPALVYQMERYKDEPDRTYHTFFCSWPNALFTEEFVEDINEEYGLDMDISKWEAFTDDLFIGYYYLLTADEIKALADKGIGCYYVGSREGEEKNINIDTLEGIYEYCELYGDQYIQYK